MGKFISTLRGKVNATKITGGLDIRLLKNMNHRHSSILFKYRQNDL